MKVQEYLEKHLPSQKAKLILDYINDRRCSLRITRPRKTKRGDFRHFRDKLSISVNHDENSYRFSFTLIHEIAHLKTFLEYENSVKPHGIEWKKNFQELFDFFEMSVEYARDRQILEAVIQELKNPKACSGVSLELEKAFSYFDSSRTIYLEEVDFGSAFMFKNVVYKKLEDRRSRVLCLNVSNQKRYTISKAASVELC